MHCKYPGKLHTIPYNFNVRNCIGALTGKPNTVLANGIIRSLVRARKSTLRLVMSFIATTSKRLDYECPAANRTWQRPTIISCDLTYNLYMSVIPISLTYPTLTTLLLLFTAHKPITIKTTKVDKNKPSQFYYRKIPKLIFFKGPF